MSVPIAAALVLSGHGVEEARDGSAGVLVGKIPLVRTVRFVRVVRTVRLSGCPGMSEPDKLSEAVAWSDVCPDAVRTPDKRNPKKNMGLSRFVRAGHPYMSGHRTRLVCAPSPMLFDCRQMGERKFPKAPSRPRFVYLAHR